MSLLYPVEFADNEVWVSIKQLSLPTPVLCADTPGRQQKPRFRSEPLGMSLPAPPWISKKLPPACGLGPACTVFRSPLPPPSVHLSICPFAPPFIQQIILRPYDPDNCWVLGGLCGTTRQSPYPPKTSLPRLVITQTHICTHTPTYITDRIDKLALKINSWCENPTPKSSLDWSFLIAHFLTAPFPACFSVLSWAEPHPSIFSAWLLQSPCP